MSNSITDTMSPEQKRDYQQSCLDFDAILKPFLLLKLDKIFDISITTDATLDREHGIDFIATHLQSNKFVDIPIACKTQKVSSPWPTICVRYSRGSGRTTEYEKIKKLIETDSIRPWVHMHAYFDMNGNVLKVYIVKTDDLFRWLKTNIETVDRRYKYGDSFLAIKVSDLKRDGVDYVEL